MRKIVAVAVGIAALAAGSALPARSDEAPAPDPAQTVAGTVAAPTRFTNPDQGYPGLGRRLYLANTALNGITAYVFAVDPATWGGAFDLGGVTDATNMADLGIYFYSDFGSIDPTAGPGAAVSTAEYDVTAVGGEKGYIPPGSTKGLVFMKTGAKAAFNYKAFPETTVSLAAGPLDVTVPSGAFVAWLNDTGDYAFVRHVAADGEEVLFDSSPGVATGLRNGERFRHQFSELGTYTYETGTGAGTVTVVAGPGPGTPAG